MNEIIYKQISGTLDYGLKMPTAMIIYWWVNVLIGVGSAVAFTVATVLEHEPLLIIAAVLFPVFFLVISGYVLIRERKHRQIIELWCEDAVELTVSTSRIYCDEAQKFLLHYDTDDHSSERGSAYLQLFNNRYKYYPLFLLKVNVNYKGEQHTFYSLKRPKSQFDSFFLRSYAFHSEMVQKYGAGRADVLYSPKYNKVMFLKGKLSRPNLSNEVEDMDELVEIFDENAEIK